MVHVHNSQHSDVHTHEDHDHDRKAITSLTLSEFKTELEGHGIHVTDQEALQIFEAADFDDNDLLEGEEIEAALSSIQYADPKKSPQEDAAGLAPAGSDEESEQEEDDTGSRPVDINGTTDNLEGFLDKKPTDAPVDVEPLPGQGAAVSSRKAMSYGPPETISYKELTEELGYTPKYLVIDGNVKVTGVPHAVPIRQENAHHTSNDELDNSGGPGGLSSPDTGYSTHVDPNTKTVKTTVKVYLYPADENVDPAALEKKKKVWKEGVDQAFDSKNTGVVFVDQNGQEWNHDVDIEYVDTPQEADRKVGVTSDPGYRSDTKTWALDEPGYAAAHEVGHFLGAEDRYTDNENGRSEANAGYENSLMGDPHSPGAHLRPAALQGVADAASTSSWFNFTPAMRAGETEVSSSAVGGAGGTQAFDSSVGARGNLESVQFWEDEDGNLTGMAWEGTTIDNKPVQKGIGTKENGAKPIDFTLEKGEEITGLTIGVGESGTVVSVTLTTSSGRTISAGKPEDAVTTKNVTANEGSAISGFHGSSDTTINSLGAVFGHDSPMVGIV